MSSDVLRWPESRRLETEYSEAEEQQRIEAVMSAYPQIERWVVGGHTWGGFLPAVWRYG